MPSTPATSSPATPDHAELRQHVAAGEHQLRALITSLLTAPNLLDRDLLGELAAFLDHTAWVALDAAEQLSTSTTSAATASTASGVQPGRAAA